MKQLLLFLLIFFLFYSCSNFNDSKSHNTESQQLKNIEDSGDWEVLFDGSTLDKWRGFKQETVPDGWVIEDDALVALGKGGDLGGDIITKKQYEAFELKLDWAISEGGNSGIFFHVLEDNYQTVYATGPEYQLIDDVGFPQKLEDWQKTGANYAMNSAHNTVLKPIGEYNTSRIIVKNGHVEHWLNGKMVVNYELWTDDWKARVAKSKWKDYPGYGLALKGYIGLQDHGSLVKFKNIKIKDLTEPGQPLFNNKNLNDWKIYGTEKWYVENDKLICESGPDKQYGYLGTIKTYKNFILRLKFKQESNGNSGVFFRSTIEGTRITGWQVEVAPSGFDSGGIYESYGRGWLYQIPDEKESILKEGEWNEMVIKVVEDRVMTWLNNELMTDLRDNKIGEADGSIALQIHDGGGVKVLWKGIFIKEF